MHLKVNVGSADLSYGGCTIWHNDGCTHRYSLWERAESLESVDDHENPISSHLERDRASGALSSSSSTSTKHGFSPHYSRYLN